MIGDLVKSLRVQKEMTQQDLANKLSISASTIGMYEQNRRAPDINTLISIAHIFNVSTDYLLTGKKNPITSLTDEENELLSYYKKLSKIDQRWIMGQIIDIVKKCEKETSEKEKKTSGK